jgi:Tol biopolymer transport system component
MEFVMRAPIMFAVTVLVATCIASPAVAKTAGSNGQIAYNVDDDVVFTINSDGTGQRQLTPSGIPGCCATWSPDGTKLAMAGSTDDGRIGTALVNADGTDRHVLPIPVPGLNLVCNVWSPSAERLACQGWNDDDPSMNGIYTARTDGFDVQRITSGPDNPLDYSPDGANILFERADQSRAARGNALFTVDVDGAVLNQITAYGAIGANCCGGSWSPDGQWILTGGKARVWLLHPDGTGLRQIHLDVSRYRAFAPSWSPDGTRIVFAMYLPGRNSDIYTATRDGTDLVQVTDTPGHEGSPDWGTHPPQH